MNDWALVYDEGNGWGHERRMRALGSSLEARGAVAALSPLRGAVGGSRIVVDSYEARADDRDRFDAELIVAFDDLQMATVPWRRSTALAATALAAALTLAGAFGPTEGLWLGVRGVAGAACLVALLAVGRRLIQEPGVDSAPAEARH